MRTVVLAHEVDLEGWRTAARTLAMGGVPPQDVIWSVGAPDDLFASTPLAPELAPASAFAVPRPLVELAQTVIQSSDPQRFALLYGLIWRVRQGERAIMQDTADPQLDRALRLAQSVQRDTHKMRAFLRFREVTSDAGSRYVAWFEPAHFIVEANADFFIRRFSNMMFTILTPYRSLHWTGDASSFGPGADPAEVPDDDALATYWQAYFGAIFNPARLKISAMTSEMPRKYWRNLPEAAAIPDLIRGAEARTQTMLEQHPMTPPTPLAALAEEAASCRRCALWQPATQTVFGEGPADARMMLVGEQPGDQEDLAGRPFVGPAGQVLDRALREAGIDRQGVYVTNAVKHFKFEPRGKRRIHQKPETAEIVACAGWLEAERRSVAPRLLVMLGATAARAVLGRAVTISRERGRPIPLAGTSGLVTVHPSYLLRLPDEAAKAREYAAFVADLVQARQLAEG
ncbi:UdgX family uracil-DNA binding protein [Lichenicoccus sp.]|uniref:UdgX family uracil-DNA binding protein n=1 Tax=Lichenicoccus sp. TaxID=2781899 RepID=UPI003D0C8EBE